MAAQFKQGDAVRVKSNTYKGKRVILDHPAWDRKNAWWVRLVGGPVVRSVTSLVDECEMEADQCEKA